MSLAIAIECAARCVLPNGDRHPHQRRTSVSKLERGAARLGTAGLENARSFADLYDRVAHVAFLIDGLGDTWAYDVARRIGAHMGLEPDRVYVPVVGYPSLHRDIALSDLPEPLRRLSPAEASEFLRAHKREMREILLNANPRS